MDFGRAEPRRGEEFVLGRRWSSLPPSERRGGSSPLSMARREYRPRPSSRGSSTRGWSASRTQSIRHRRSVPAGDRRTSRTRIDPRPPARDRVHSRSRGDRQGRRQPRPLRPLAIRALRSAARVSFRRGSGGRGEIGASPGAAVPAAASSREGSRSALPCGGRRRSASRRRCALDPCAARSSQSSFSSGAHRCERRKPARNAGSMRAERFVPRWSRQQQRG